MSVPIITVKEIVIKYLKDNKFDGLCNPEYRCECSAEDEDDICPCANDDIIISSCSPGRKCNQNIIRLGK